MAKFLQSKLARTCIALAAGALAPAAGALVLGDFDTVRIAVASAFSAVVAAVALHFKSDGTQ